MEDTYLLKPITPDILPFSPRYLSPRYHISANKFHKVRLLVSEMNGGIKCQNCGNSERKIDLHESFVVTENKYTFIKFVLLCANCHRFCHPTYIDRMALYPFLRFSNLNDSYILKYVECGTFKDINTAIDVSNNRYDNAYKFSLADKVTCDYSAVDKYGLSSKEITKSFYEKYNPLISKYLFFNHLIEHNYGVVGVFNNGIFLNCNWYNKYAKDLKDNRIILMDNVIKKHPEFFQRYKSIIMENNYHKLKAAILNDNVREIELEIELLKQKEKYNKEIERHKQFMKEMRRLEKLFKKGLITKKELKKQISKII